MTPRLLLAALGAPAAGSAGPSPCARGHKPLALCAGCAGQATRMRACAAHLPSMRLMRSPCTLICASARRASAPEAAGLRR